MEDCLSRLVGVVVLKLHTVCTDSMLATISSTCSHLASLDIRWLQTIDIDMNIYHASPSFSKHVTDLGVVEAVCGDHSLLPARLQQILLDGTSVTSRSHTSQILTCISCCVW